MEPIFSVIIPIYNAEKTISKCLESILNQTINSVEIICINDNSSDNSNIILERYQKKYNQIKVINLKKNSGAAKARNIGLKESTGKIITFVDSDDDIDMYHLQDVYNKMLSEQSDINIISFKFIKQDKIFYFSDLSKFITKFGSKTQKLDTVEKLTFLDDYCWRLNILRSFWQKNKIFFPENIKSSEDQCFWKPLELKADRISFLENYGYNYYWNPTSVTKQEMSSFETVRGIDELMRRLPKEYHIPLMEKCCKRIHDFKMKNKKLMNKLKYCYVKRIYRTAKQYGIKNYELSEYNYKRYCYTVEKTKNNKIIKIFGIKIFKKTY